jgi:hypothetical protein
MTVVNGMEEEDTYMFCIGTLFLAPSDSLPPLFLSVSTLRVRPESIET